MFKGQIDLNAPVINGTITFEQVDINASWISGVRLRLSCAEADMIRGTVWVSGVQSREIVVQQAQSIFESVLSRLAYSLEMAIGLSKITSSQVEPEIPPLGHTLHTGTGYFYLTGLAPIVRRSVQPNEIQQIVDIQSPRGETRYGEFRSAQLSTGGVEEFVHLYRLLLELCGDSQGSVDQFILKAEPSILCTPSPKHPNISETLYTRLRNELAHRRQGVDVEATKNSMVQYVGGLRKIVRQAITQFG